MKVWSLASPSSTLCFEEGSLEDPDRASVTSVARCSTRMDAFPSVIYVYGVHVCWRMYMCMCVHVCLGEGCGVSPRLTSAVFVDCCLSCFRQVLSH